MSNQNKSPWLLLFIHGLIFVFALGLDQLSKFFFYDLLTKSNVVKILPFFNLRLELNTGCAFSLFDGCANEHGRLILVVIGLLVICFFLISALKRMKSGFYAFGETLVIAGGLGNILDRFLHGAVVDFIYLHMNGYHWPTFNLADCMIFMGIFIVAKRAFLK